MADHENAQLRLECLKIAERMHEKDTWATPMRPTERVIFLADMLHHYVLNGRKSEEFNKEALRAAVSKSYSQTP